VRSEYGDLLLGSLKAVDGQVQIQCRCFLVIAFLNLHCCMMSYSVRRGKNPCGGSAVAPFKDALLASIPSPKFLVAAPAHHVIGQEVAKRRLALGVSNHLKWFGDGWDQGAADPIVTEPDLHNVRIEKSNILLIGPSGSGKTHLVSSLAAYLDVPLAPAAPPAVAITTWEPTVLPHPPTPGT
jgi:ATP-dependent protease Clp ATPase subunit